MVLLNLLSDSRLFALSPELQTSRTKWSSHATTVSHELASLHVSDQTMERGIEGDHGKQVSWDEDNDENGVHIDDHERTVMELSKRTHYCSSSQRPCNLFPHGWSSLKWHLEFAFEWIPVIRCAARFIYANWYEAMRKGGIIRWPSSRASIQKRLKAVFSFPFLLEAPSKCSWFNSLESQLFSTNPLTCRSFQRLPLHSIPTRSFLGHNELYEAEGQRCDWVYSLVGKWISSLPLRI